MELGSNSPLIVMPDADLDKVIQATVASGYSNAGQVCISTQRVLADRRIYADYLEGLKEGVEKIKIGNPIEEGIELGPMVREEDAVRVGAWIDEAVASGATVVTGGDREGAIFSPTVVADVKPEMKISCEEIFGPAVAVTPIDNIDDAIALANDSEYGLSAGIFTPEHRLGHEVCHGSRVREPAHQLRPAVARRPDALRRSEIQRHGQGKAPRYAVEEMTELKMVVMHL